MPTLPALCHHLMACFEELTERELTDAKKRTVTVIVEDCPTKLIPVGVQTWVPWVVDSPVPFLARLIASHPPLRRVVNTMRQIRGHSLYTGDSGLRETFRNYFEDCICKTPWLNECDIEHVYFYPPSGPNYDGPEADEWQLALRPTPVARLERLIAMAKDVLGEHSRQQARVNFVDGDAKKPALSDTDTAILEALDGVALCAKSLHQAVGGDSGNMHRRLRRLKSQNPPLVGKNESRGAWYRPDRPPQGPR
jgi:hypothetical protein